MFSGYNPLWYKLFVWTLSAVLCGIAGALYVPQVGIINPSEMSPANSIEMAIWAAVGGRGTLIGPIIGACIVNGAKSWFTALPRILAVLPGPAVHPGDAVHAARRSRAAASQGQKNVMMSTARPASQGSAHEHATASQRPRQRRRRGHHATAPSCISKTSR